MMKDGFTLAHPDKEVREYWIEHGKEAAKSRSTLGKKLGKQVSITFGYLMG